MHLILAGGGNAEQSKEVDMAFRKLMKGKRVLYIPIAWQRSFSDMWAIGLFKKLGLEFDTWISVKYKEYKDLEKYDAIYIGGGNTFSLLHDLREAKFIPHLKKYIKSGRPVYGGSAGAIIFGEHIGTAGFGGDADENLPKLKDLHGLAFLHGYAVGCHYSRPDDRHYKSYSKKCAVIALPEETGLHVEDNRITVLGSKSAYLFEKGKKTELPVGSIATFS